MRAIVNFANNRHVKGQSRLFNTLISNQDVRCYKFNEYEQCGSPTHQENPFAFKLYAIEIAKRLDNNILYVDASVYSVRDISPLYEIIEQEGYLMQEAGHMVGTWANDECLKYFGISREQAMKMPMYGNAGLLGLNFENKIAIEFFDLWMKSCKAGAFKGSFDNHRHDMTCGSIIANQLGMKYKSGNEILAYAGPEDEVNDTIILKAQGV